MPELIVTVAVEVEEWFISLIPTGLKTKQRERGNRLVRYSVMSRFAIDM